MSRYIDANVLKEAILKERDAIPLTTTERYSFGVEKPYRDGNSMRGGIRKALRCLEQTPTADVVEVVRCKECKHYKSGECRYHSEPKEMRMYERWTVDVNENDYCSYGKRRKGT